MELKTGYIIIYESTYSEIINKDIQIYIKIDSISEIISKDIILTKNGDRIYINQIKKILGEKENNPLYNPNWFFKEKDKKSNIENLSSDFPPKGK